MEQFFRKFQKHVILDQNDQFLARLTKIVQNEKFYQKSDHAIFLPLLSSNFMLSFRKLKILSFYKNVLNSIFLTRLIKIDQNGNFMKNGDRAILLSLTQHHVKFHKNY